MLSEGTKGGSLHFKLWNIWSPFYKPRLQYSSHLTNCKSSSRFENYRIFYTFEYYFLATCLCTIWFGREEREFVLCSVPTSITGHEERSPLLLSLYGDITIPVMESFKQWQKNFITTADRTSKQFKLLSVPLHASLILMLFLQKAPTSSYFSSITLVTPYKLNANINAWGNCLFI